MKKMISRLLMIVALSLMCSISVSATPKVKSIEYEGNGKVEIDFKTKVQYKKTKVKAVDEDGNKIPARILDMDRDDLVIRLEKYPQGKRIVITVSGVKKKTEKRYSSIRGNIWIPTCTVGNILKNVDYDHKDRKVEFEFLKKVKWKNPKVTIKHGKKQYAVKIKDTESRELEVKAKLAKGVIYQYTISGILINGKEKTITGLFKA